jgi:glutamate-1-semialdehyde aminotransferase
MIGRGIFTPPTGAPHIGAAHTEEDVKKILAAAREVVRDMS